MPRESATTFGPPRGGVRIPPALPALALLASVVLVPTDGFAEGGYARPAPPPYGYGPPPGARRCPPPRPTCHAGVPPYGGPAIVRAYLPRNNALPMYNEPPQRFPE